MKPSSNEILLENTMINLSVVFWNVNVFFEYKYCFEICNLLCMYPVKK